MTANDASPKPKRKPSGAAVAGAHPRPTLYPRQVIFMLTDEQADRIAREAEAEGMSKSEVGRLYLDAGFAYADRLTREDRRKLGK